MAKLLKLRRGTTTQHGSFTGAEGEVTIDTTKDTAVIHDGSTQGGTPLAKENMDNVSSANIAARIGANAIDGSKISDGTITNAEVNASAAIAGTKVAPYFGSQDITTTGHIDFPDDSSIKLGNNDEFVIRHTGAGVSELSSTKVDVSGNLDVSGTLDVTGNLDANAGVDVTGAITSTGNLTISNSAPTVVFTDTNNDSDFKLILESGLFRIQDVTNGNVSRFTIGSDGTVDVTGNLDVGAGVDVTGNITCTGTVDGVDVAGLHAATSGLSTGSGILHSSVSIANGVTAHTQSAGNNSTKVATTAYTDTAIANLVDSSPGALNTLNELAAAIGDDANFSTTITNSIATKLPKSGGQMTGNITMSGSQTVDGRDLSVDGAKLDGIESGATADQTASEILTLIKTVDGSGSGLDADTIDGLTSGSFVRNNNSNQSIAGNLTVGTGTDSSIYMVDTDNGNRTIHCNSDRIGFLTSVGAWGCYADDSGNWTASGNITAYSDSRLKTDISTINNALGIVGKLRGVSYKWLRDGSDGIGVIAQEVEKVIPSVVVTTEKPGLDGMEEIKSVDYGKIVGVLINAINELNTKLETQESYFLGELEKHKSGGH